MGSISKGFSLLFVVILAVSNLILVESAFAQSIPKPSVPEFTVKLIDHPYDVPSSTTISTDPYTGKQTITTYPGYHVQNRSIEVTIKNQQFTPYSIDNQNTLYLFYNVSYKGHYAGDWTYYPSGSYSRNSDAVTRISQSTSDHTVVPFSALTEGQMDYRVQAQIGYYDSYQEYIAVPGAPFTHYTFTGEVSGWSSTQTLTIPAGSVSTSTPSPTSSSNPTTAPTTTPTTTNSNGNSISVPLSTLIAVVAIFLAIIVALSLLLFTKHRKTISQNKPTFKEKSIN